MHLGEGNGNPLQCSHLENPRDEGAWWAAVYGVAQSWTRLKRLSSSSSSSLLLIGFHVWTSLCVLSCSVVSDYLWTSAHQSPRSVGFSRKDDCSWLQFPPPGDLPYLGTEPIMQKILHLLHCRQFLYHWATWEAQVSLCIVPFSVANGLGGSENATGEPWTRIFQFWVGEKCFRFPITKIIGQDSNWWVWILWPPLGPITETEPERYLYVHLGDMRNGSFTKAQDHWKTVVNCFSNMSFLFMEYSWVFMELMGRGQWTKAFLDIYLQTNEGISNLKQYPLVMRLEKGIINRFLVNVQGYANTTTMQF